MKKTKSILNRTYVKSPQCIKLQKTVSRLVTFCTALVIYGHPYAAKLTFEYSDLIGGLQTHPSFPTGGAFYFFPGSSSNPSTSDNTVTINFISKINPVSVFGGSHAGALDVSNNTLNFIQGKASSIHGGYSNTGAATYNTVNFSNGDVASIYGGHSEAGVSTYNTINLNTQYGNNVRKVVGGYSSSGSASNNTVNVHHVAGKNSSGGTGTGTYVFGGESYSKEAFNNLVVMHGGTMEGVVAGISEHGAVYGNTIILNGGEVDVVAGGNSGNSDTHHNTVTMNGGTVKGTAYGQDLMGGFSIQGKSYANTINLNGGTVTGYILAGGSFVTDEVYDNTVNIRNRPDLTQATLYGGVSWGASTIQPVNRNNTLNYSAEPLSLIGMAGFGYYNFDIPASATNGTKLITASGAVDVDNARVEVKSIAAGSPLVSGNHVVLIDADTLTGTAIPVNSFLTQGISLSYDITVSQRPNQVIATLGIKHVNPQLKSLSEGRIAALAFTVQGADLVAEQSSLACIDEELEGQFCAFGTMSGGTNKYKSGSHVDVDGFSMLAGAAYKNKALLIGAFIEGGWGNYDSYNNFIAATSVHGKGDTKYYGVGLLGRYDFNNGLYADGSIRFGKNDTDYKSLIFFGGNGTLASYDLKKTYYSAHIGAGYDWQFSDKSSLDISAKYLWTHVGGGSVNVAGDPIHFDDTDSHRVRLAGQFKHALNERASLSAGLGYEYEFDGKANATTYYFYKVDAPSIKGGSGLAELGIRFLPTANKNLTLDFKIKGYVGKREGINGTAQIEYAF